MSYLISLSLNWIIHEVNKRIISGQLSSFINPSLHTKVSLSMLLSFFHVILKFIDSLVDLIIAQNYVLIPQCHVQETVSTFSLNDSAMVMRLDLTKGSSIIVMWLKPLKTLVRQSLFLYISAIARRTSLSKTICPRKMKDMWIRAIPPNHRPTMRIRHGANAAAEVGPLSWAQPRSARPWRNHRCTSHYNQWWFKLLSSVVDGYATKLMTTIALLQALNHRQAYWRTIRLSKMTKVVSGWAGLWSFNHSAVLSLAKLCLLYNTV